MSDDQTDQQDLQDRLMAAVLRGDDAEAKRLHAELCMELYGFVPYLMEG